MRRLERITNTLFGIENSSVDPNKFYSILLDARAATVSENMCDIAEKLLHGEKVNAQSALDQLLKLKKNLFSGKNDTIDLLIAFYQEKLDILEGREERLKKVSLDSRSLLEEKRKKDEEVATVKQQVADCKKELDTLTVKLEKLKIREQELLLIEHQLREELGRNENEIVNGLYEILLPRTDNGPEDVFSVTLTSPEPLQSGPKPAAELKTESVAVDKPVAVPPPFQTTDTTITAVFEPPVIPDIPLIADASPIEETTPETHEPEPAVKEPGIFQKSIVKTTEGKIIGEYYYDAKVYKNVRHYIFNSLFFADSLLKLSRSLNKKFTAPDFSDLVQMAQDSYKRINENKQLHFEVATNEILNEKTLKRLWQDAKLRSFDEIERFALRLKAKIDALGNNYETMLKEQMQRCVAKQ